MVRHGREHAGRAPREDAFPAPVAPAYRFESAQWRRNPSSSAHDAT